MTILVTGGCGFIGSNFILEWLAQSDEAVINVDCLTYAANPKNLVSLAGSNRYRHVHCSIGDGDRISALLAENEVRAVVNFAAESHVDRSILGPAAFVETNVVGTMRLLDAVRGYYDGLAADARARFRFVHVSTDEVYGTLTPEARPFREGDPYRPNSPYAASKAASDHLVRAYRETYGLPTLTTNCSNNYGPYHFPEKLIPLVILNAIAGKALPIYGDGLNVRDWLYVSDHCAAIRLVLERGRVGETYNIGGSSEMTNLAVVNEICAVLDAQRPALRPYADQITFVRDRPGHDRRYAVDAGKIRAELGWRPTETFASGIRKTVAWNLANETWIADVTSGAYRSWIARQYA
ncbi:MAG TPA: dTDP-glucose 4,6-dehydratase [Bauldia sp.]|nr:dTDP-glucose 4,6-dehydratase [Bauldia sp.]